MNPNFYYCITDFTLYPDTSVIPTVSDQSTPIYRTQSPRHPIIQFGINNHSNGWETSESTPLQRLHLSIGFILGAVTLAFALIRTLEESKDTAVTEEGKLKPDSRRDLLWDMCGWIRRCALITLMTGYTRG